MAEIRRPTVPGSHRRLRLAFLVASASPLLGCAGATASPAAATPAVQANEGQGVFGEWVMSGGTQRTYALHIPPQGCDAARPCPLILAFHGAGGNHTFAERVGLYTAADRRGFVVVAPDGVSGDWALRCGGCTVADRVGIDDVRFVTTLVDQIASSLAVDRDRIYATGRSDGGTFTHRLACDYALAAIGVVSGTLFNPQLCAARVVSLIAFHGTADTVIPVGQGAGAAQFRAQLDGCGLQPTATPLPDLVDDGTSITRNDFPGCDKGSAVVFFSVLGGGHNWPGSPTPEGGGVLSQEIKASEEMVDFFAAHTLAR